MKIAVCLYVRNERHDILEWMLHHINIGFDTIFVMDNNSDDDTGDVVRCASTIHDIRFESWPETGTFSQIHCYDSVLQRHGSEFDWMAFIDADEFILPLRDRNIKLFLSKFESHAAIALNWAIFGSNGLRRAPNGFVMEEYVRRSDEHFHSNRHVKSIVRPAFVVSAVNPHIFGLSQQHISHCGGYANASGDTVRWSDQLGITDSDPDLTVCRVNHYYTRSRQHFDEKIRRKTWRDPERAEDEFVYNDRNEIEDRSALPFAEAVHVLADQIRPSVRFTPAKYGALPTIPFGSRFRDHVEPEPGKSDYVEFRNPMKYR